MALAYSSGKAEFLSDACPDPVCRHRPRNARARCGCGRAAARARAGQCLSGHPAGAGDPVRREPRRDPGPRRDLHRGRVRRPHLPAQIYARRRSDLDRRRRRHRPHRPAPIAGWRWTRAPAIPISPPDKGKLMRVLIVEDEPNLGRQLRATLEGAGYAIDLATDGEDGHYLGSTETYDAIILDLGLPEVDGLTVLDRWRRDGMKVPVLAPPAGESWSDRVAGLDAGADDYLAKPFQTEELIARLRALIRRAAGVASSELIAGDIRLDTRSGKVTKSGEPVKLTAQEYKLLSYLMHHKGKVVSRTELIEHIYAKDFDRDSNTIEVFVTRIRKKLGADVITTIRGLGYSLEEPVS